jgi:molybdenum cofactor cytidylyltransferase
MILVHNVIGPDGHKVLPKGHVVQAEDLEKIKALGRESVYVARLDPDDVPEDDAATQLARIVVRDSVTPSKSSGGRVNLYAAHAGFLRINRDALKRINELDGVTLASIPRYTAIAPKQMVATLKTIGLALPKAALREVEKIVDARGHALEVAAIQNSRVAVILTGSENGKAKVQALFGASIRTRIDKLGVQLVSDAFVDESPKAIAAALVDALSAGAQLVIIAGETSIMDIDDTTPQGIKTAGGQIELFGAPVEPGNLLLLAYCGSVPIIGAPGCIKSPERNIVDIILPPLLIGERVKRADVIALAEGGLLHASQRKDEG